MNFLSADLLMVGFGLIYLYLMITSVFTWIWYDTENYNVENINNRLIYKSAHEVFLPLDDEGNYEVDLNTLTPNASGEIEVSL